MNKSSDTALVVGSLAQIAQSQNVSIAESFLSVDAIILCDVSGSMDMHDSRGGKTRYEVALEELARLQGDLPGKLCVIGFASQPAFAPTGQPIFTGSGTDLAAALQFVKVADDGDMRFIVISDGQPDEPEKALGLAAGFQGRIDGVYVGAEGDSTGRRFLERLAAAHKGQAVTAAQACQLAAKTSRLLLAAI
jgi:hypothetical protein